MTQITYQILLAKDITISDNEEIIELTKDMRVLKKPPISLSSIFFKGSSKILGFCSGRLSKLNKKHRHNKKYDKYLKKEQFSIFPSGANKKIAAASLITLSLVSSGLVAKHFLSDNSISVKEVEKHQQPIKSNIQDLPVTLQNDSLAPLSPKPISIPAPIISPSLPKEPLSIPAPIISSPLYKEPLSIPTPVDIEPTISLNTLLNYDTDTLNEYLKQVNVPLDILGINKWTDLNRKAIVGFLYGAGEHIMSQIVSSIITDTEGVRRQVYTDSGRYNVPTIASGISLVVKGKEQWKSRSFAELKELLNRGEAKLTTEQIKRIFKDLSKIANYISDIDILYQSNNLLNKTKMTSSQQSILNNAHKIRRKYGKSTNKETITYLKNNINYIIYGGYSRSSKRSNAFNFSLTTEGAQKVSTDYTIHASTNLILKLKYYAKKKGYDFNCDKELNNPLIATLISHCYQKGACNSKLFNHYLSNNVGDFFLELLTENTNTKSRIPKEFVATLQFSEFSDKQLISLSKSLVNKETRFKNAFNNLKSFAHTALMEDKYKFSYEYLTKCTKDEMNNRGLSSPNSSFNLADIASEKTSR